MSFSVKIIRPLTAEGRCRYHGVTERDLGQTVVLALGVIFSRLRDDVARKSVIN